MPADLALPARPIVPAIVMQHVEDCAALRHVRSVLVRAPHVRLLHLGRLDERLAAHLDGLQVAGEPGRALCEQELAAPGAGPVFALAAAALEAGDEARLRRVVALAAEGPDAAADARRGLLAALGWWPFERVQPTLRRLLAASAPVLRALGLCGHRLHGADPGAALVDGLQDDHPAVRRSALRVTAALGCSVHAAAAAELAEAQDDPALACHAACTAVLLGRRGRALEVLRQQAWHAEQPFEPALALLLQASSFDAARDTVRALARAAGGVPSRRLVRAAGVLGDAALVPWLLELTEQPALTRLAGESIATITGVDLAWLDLDRKPPAEPVAGPNDDPAADEVALDEDDSLPWPDPARLGAWWRENAPRFAPGTRWFCGAPPSPAHALQVLNAGFQRQRSLAAAWRCLLQPGTPLFNIAAPVPRQRRVLAAIG